MAVGDVIVGIDIGTSKVCTILGEVNNFGQIEILCTTTCKCNGLKKGKIVNEEAICTSISETIKEAEDEVGFKINSAYLTIPGKYVTIVQNSILKEVKDKFTGITQKDLQNAVSYISNELKNKQAASNLIDLVEETVKSLTDMPERYAVVDDEILSREGFRFIQIKNYLLFYVVRKETQTVVIQRFLYARRDWMNILKLDIATEIKN